jgi:hypothetical protein
MCCGLASLSATLLAALSIKLARTQTPLTYWPTPSTAPLPTLSSQVSLLHTLGQMAVLAARVACPQATSASAQLTFWSTYAQVLFPDTRYLKYQETISRESIRHTAQQHSHVVFRAAAIIFISRFLSLAPAGGGCTLSAMPTVDWPLRVHQCVGIWQPLPAASLQVAPCPRKDKSVVSIIQFWG